MKTNELTGPTLDWAVLEASGNPSKLEWRKASYGGLQVRMTTKLLGVITKDWSAYGPSEIWAQGGPIIERECITVGPYYDKGERVPNSWQAYAGWNYEEMEATFEQDGPTPLIAAMRSYVALKLGDEVEIPEELT